VKQKLDHFTSKISIFSFSHQGSITPSLVPPVCKAAAADRVDISQASPIPFQPSV